MATINMGLRHPGTLEFRARQGELVNYVDVYRNDGDRIATLSDYTIRWAGISSIDDITDDIEAHEYRQIADEIDRLNGENIDLQNNKLASN